MLCSVMKNHVGNHKSIFTETKQTVNIVFTVLLLCTQLLNIIHTVIYSNEKMLIYESRYAGMIHAVPSYKKRFYKKPLVELKEIKKRRLVYLQDHKKHVS